MPKNHLTPAMMSFARRPETGAKWLAALEEAGVANVRDAVNSAGMLSPTGMLYGIGDEVIAKGFMQSWLRDREAEASRHQWMIAIASIGLGLIAAVAAVIAAWPVVMSWL